MLKVLLSKSMDAGCYASIENVTTDYHDVLTIAGSNNTTISRVCELAVTRLRVLANKFEALAKEKDPYNKAVQKKINNRRKFN